MSVYAVSDMHGNLKAWKKIKEFVKPEDKIYVLGDCGDRGPDPWTTIKEVLTDPQVVYIKGNHDDMLVKAAREAMDGSYGSEKQRLLAHNGGYNTLNELLYEDRPEIWISMLAKLPTHTTYINENGKEIFLCHAGCSFYKDEEKTIPKSYDLMWDRLHYFDNASLLSDIVVVHGHTWINYIKEDLNIENTENEFLFYTNNKKICIDLGTCHTGKAGILNLDTFDAVYFNI